MNNFNRGGGFSGRNSGGGFGRRDSGGRSFNRGSESGRPAMHKAVCADCGQSCEVPFKPTGDRPIFCSNCFKGKDGSNSRQSVSRDFGKSNFSEKRENNGSISGEQFATLNLKLDKILAALNSSVFEKSVSKKELKLSEEVEEVEEPIKKEVKKPKVVKTAVVKKNKKK